MASFSTVTRGPSECGGAGNAKPRCSLRKRLGSIRFFSREQEEQHKGGVCCQDGAKIMSRSCFWVLDLLFLGVGLCFARGRRARDCDGVSRLTGSVSAGWVRGRFEHSLVSGGHFIHNVPVSFLKRLRWDGMEGGK